jgi:DNA-directed RNA polymerase subunit RPC12/RpoP
MFDLDFEYKCPHCGEEYTGEHDLNTEIINQTLDCDECGKKYKLKSKITMTIECEATKA